MLPIIQEHLEWLNEIEVKWLSAKTPYDRFILTQYEECFRAVPYQLNIFLLQHCADEIAERVVKFVRNYFSTVWEGGCIPDIETVMDVYWRFDNE